MSKKTSLVMMVVAVVVVVIGLWLGGGYLWDLLLAMHGKR